MFFSCIGYGYFTYDGRNKQQETYDLGDAFAGILAVTIVAGLYLGKMISSIISLIIILYILIPAIRIYIFIGIYSLFKMYQIQNQKQKYEELMENKIAMV